MNFLCILFIIASYFCAPLSASHQGEEESMIENLAELNIQSTKWDDGEWWDEEDYATFLKKYLECIKNPHERFKRTSAYKIAKKISWDVAAPALHDRQVWNDLDLFYGRSKRSAYVAQKIDRTCTELGKISLYALLAQPISDLSVITKRQAVIRCLTQNQASFEKIRLLLDQMAHAEPFILTLFNQAIIKNTTRRCYFDGLLSQGNSSTCALQVRTLFNHIIRNYGVVSAGLAAVALFTYGATQLLYVPNEWIDQKAQEYKNDAGYMVRFLWPFLNHPLLRGVLAVGGSFLCAETCYENIQWEYARSIMEVMVQEITMNIGLTINSLLEIAQAVQNFPDIMALEDFAPIIQFYERVQRLDSPEHELCDLLASSTLQGEPSFFSLQGITLRAFKLFDELKESLVPALMAAGKLDAYTSCAYLIKESANRSAQFTLAQWSVHDKPTITAQGLWHPFINSDDVVTHAYELGKDDALRVMILTGPNEGGKSTILKELAIALIMAQSIGIVPAQKFIATPFAMIATYLTVADDTASGDSLFRASAIRAGQLLDKIETAAPGSFVFAAFDELFSGTSPHEGEAAAYSIVKGIGESPYVISAVATHFPQLTLLEQQSPAFGNYKVAVNFCDNGVVEYPYTLERGASNQHVALHVLRSQGITHRFLDEAVKLIAK